MPAVSEDSSLEMFPWNTWTYLCHHFWSWFLPFPRLHLWRWFLEILGSISATFLELVPAFSEVPSLEIVPWNTWTYLCHHFWSWFLPFPRFHLWRWFIEIHGPISATVYGAGSTNNKASIALFCNDVDAIHWGILVYCASTACSKIPNYSHYTI